MNKNQCIGLDPVYIKWFFYRGRKHSFIAKFDPTYKLSISVVLLLIKKLN